MDKLHEASAKIQIKWLEDVQRILHKQGHDAQDPNGLIRQLGQTIGTIYKMDKIPPSENIPPSDHFQASDQWVRLVNEELWNFNMAGDEYICSTTEALIKTNGIKRILDQFNDPMFFRGEHIFGWDLISRLGRKHKIDWDNEDPLQVTPLEMDCMTDFQDRVIKDKDLSDIVFEGSKPLPANDIGWWSLMQHYDDVHGTRMIDVTSSIFCGLYFACCNWDGSVDKENDGKLYMFNKALGRGVTQTPERGRNGQLVDLDDEFQNNINQYFAIENHVDIPRFRKSPVRNDRALSQDGWFVWQPKFDKELKNLTQHMSFRVHRDYKESIRDELASMGYTHDRIISYNRFGI